MGLDHLCAMVAVGLWAAQRGGRAIWVVPATFVLVMAMGGMLGVAGVSVPLVEPGIIASVLILGLLVAAAVRLPVAASAAVVGLFAIVHGYAHGAEMPVSASGLLYGAGFMVATAALHLCGIGLACAIARWGSVRHVRFAGGAVALCGIGLYFA
jgi:urease accessory protein